MTAENSNRDADSLTILGFFFMALGVLVLVGTIWTLGNFRAVVVNVGSGVVLTAVGCAMAVVAQFLRSE